MTKVATRTNKLGNVIAYEQAPEHGYCREMVTVTIESGMDVGAAMKLAAGKWVWIEQADIATLPADVGVLVDAVADVPNLTAGDHTLAVMVRGAAVIKDAGLAFKDALSTNETATVHAALEAKGMVVRKRV